MTGSNDAAATKATADKSYRTIPVEVLRDFYLDEVELSSLAQVAGRAGIGKSTLQSFLTGSSPHPRTRRTLGLYYVLAQGVGPREDALEVLTGGDEELKAAVLEALVDRHQHRQEVPQWLDALCQRR
jgi:hypothetical protein